MLFFKGLGTDLVHESATHVEPNPTTTGGVVPAVGVMTPFQRPAWQYALGGLALLVVILGVYSYATKP